MRKYIWYAVGEILLVMIGILLALQVSNWNQQRLDNIASIDYERRLVQDLDGEMLLLDDTKKYTRIVSEYASSAIRVIENNDAPIGEEAQTQFLISLYQASQITDPDQLKSTYQELRSSGQMNKIRNEEIRAMLTTYYDYDWTESSVIVASSPYRHLIRQEMPNMIQTKIREECGDKYIGLRVELSETCNITFDQRLTEEVVTDIMANEDLKKDLRFRIGNLDSQINLLNSQIDVLSEIIISLTGE